MTTTKNLSVALALLLGAMTGCAADAVGSDPGDGSDEVPPLPEDVDASGRYELHSRFDLATNAPGKAGEIARLLIDATDDGDDPSRWILDQVLAQLPAGQVKDFIAGAEPFVAGFINDQLLSIAPDFVTVMVTLGRDVGDMSKNFGLNETLELSKSGDGYGAIHTVVGARFKIDNVEQDFAFADYNSSNIVVNGVGITLDKPTGKLSMAEHKIGLEYGKVLRIGLDAAIIPSLDPSATTLAELLQNLVDCTEVGKTINDAVVDQLGFGPGQTLFANACKLGLQKGADLIYSKIAEIDGQALEFSVSGTAKVLDKNGDKQVDTIQSGTWAGELSYAGTPAPLSTATFFGSRM